MDHIIPAIPETKYGLSQFWLQPNREEIIVDATHAVMAPNAFVKLNANQPIYFDHYFPGQMWRQSMYLGHEPGDVYWKLFWCTNFDLEERIVCTDSRIILIA